MKTYDFEYYKNDDASKMMNHGRQQALSSNTLTLLPPPLALFCCFWQPMDSMGSEIEQLIDRVSGGFLPNFWQRGASQACLHWPGCQHSKHDSSKAMTDLAVPGQIHDLAPEYLLREEELAQGDGLLDDALVAAVLPQSSQAVQGLSLGSDILR